MKDLITLLDFISKGGGTIISSGQARGLLSHITQMEQEIERLRGMLWSGNYNDKQRMHVHDAQVIERLVDDLDFVYSESCGHALSVDEILDYANQLRQQAKEVQS